MPVNPDIVSLRGHSVRQGLRTLFHRIAVGADYSINGPMETLRSSGWRETKAIPLPRLARRIHVNQLARETVGVASRRGYRRIYGYARQKRSRNPWDRLALSFRSSMKNHQHVCFNHSDAEGFYASLIGVSETAQPTPVFQVLSLIVFGPSEQSGCFLDPLDFAHQFDGTGPQYFTPSGNRRSRHYSWVAEAGFESDFFAEGQITVPGRDMFKMYFTAREFLPFLLPELPAPDPRRLFAIARSQILA